MNNERQRLLDAAARPGGVPIVRFELRSSRENSLRSTALDLVWMTDAADSMELVRNRASCIREAVREGLVWVDFHLPVTARSRYAVYLESGLYADFCRMAEEGGKRPGFLFDTPFLKRGVLTLTAKGRRALHEG